ncbi:uncharacterized protein LOC118517528 [Anopheles stephensi]|uniref:uncharacterized protein LOC118517528 n=1 Tax=Anopheles stephensi TaxID=30069 RepID=UPI0016589769|nr:uncharacterized protein LOC118517528 [Anopheles stephensi]
MLRQCFSFLYYFHSIMGLIPFRIDDRHRVRRSTYKRRWSLTIALSTAGLVCYSFTTVTLGGSFSSSGYADFVLIRSLVLVEFFIRFSNATLCFYQILTNEAALHCYTHRFIAIVQSVWRSSRSSSTVQWMVYILVGKLVIVDVGMCTRFVLNYGINRPEHSVHGYRLVNIYVVMISAQLSNLLLLLLLFASYTFGRINDHLDHTVRQMLCFETHGSYWKRRKVLQQQICCDASDTIDRLCSRHQELTEIVQALFSIFQAPLLLINLNQFIVIVSRIYFAYITRAQTDNEYISYHRSSNYVLYLCFEAVQCCLLALGSSAVTKQARLSGITLNEFIDAPLDTRAERSIEMFGLAMLATDFRIKVAGLYVLDLAFPVFAYHNCLHASHRADTVSTKRPLATDFPGAGRLLEFVL